MDKRKKGYLWIALGVVCLVVMVGAAVVGGLAYVVYQQFAIKQTMVEPTDAAKELDQLREPQTPSTVSLTAMHVTPADIEALGPGLLVDDKQPGVTQVLIWTE